jgi:[acyl-carrier-protein] S-malonyltransferase
MTIDPTHTAFLFPGQGSQAVGMGAELAAASPEAAAIFRQADELLGFPLSQLMWDGPAADLNETDNTQPALLVHSVAVLRALQQRLPGFQPRFAAGHSLGEFSALVAAEALSFSDAVSLVRARGKAMKAAGQAQPGGMAAVLGLDLDQVEAACQQASAAAEGGVWLANDNCPGQVVISGSNEALTRATELLQTAGARKVVRLAVSIAAHSPFMQAAQADFQGALDAVELRDPAIEVIGNVNAAPLTTAEAVRADLSAQLTANVRWTESIRAMLAAGVTDFVELGSGEVLTGLVKRIDRAAGRHNLDSPDSLAALLD